MKNCISTVGFARLKARFKKVVPNPRMKTKGMKKNGGDGREGGREERLKSQKEKDKRENKR